MKSNKKKVIVLIAAIILLVFTAVLFVVYQGGPCDKNNSKDLVIDIPMGSTVDDVAHILKQKNLIKNEFVFKINFKINIAKLGLKLLITLIASVEGNISIISPKKFVKTNLL